MKISLHDVECCCPWETKARWDRETGWSRSVAKLLASITVPGEKRDLVMHTGWSALMVRCANPTVTREEVREMLRLGESVSRKSWYGHTALMIAITSGASILVVRELLSSGADPNALTRDEESPLLAALFARRWKLAELLLQAGAETKHRSRRGYTPLLAACRMGADATIIRLMIDHGADVHARDGQGWTPLMVAVGLHAPLSVLSLLLSSGADPLATDWEGTSALSLALADSLVPAPAMLLRRWIV